MTLDTVRRAVARRPWPLACLIVAVIGMGAASAHALIRRSVWLPPAPVAADALDEDPPSAPSDDAPVLYVYITPDGFERRSARIRSGPKVFVLRNTSGLDTLHFTVTRVGGGVVADGGLRSGAARVVRADVPPGDYLITEASHPDWSCTVSAE